MNSVLENKGLKATCPRIKILTLLKNSDKKHLTAYDIINKLNINNESLSNSTVYRVLSDLESSNIITKSRFGNNDCVYEFNNGTKHDHLICNICGNIDDINIPRKDEIESHLSETFGHKNGSFFHTVYGICSSCT
jgi:Fur family ferric uptake transcriptional regulator